MHHPAHASIMLHIKLWHSGVGSFFSVAYIRTLDKREVMVQCHRIPECYCQSGASLTAWKHCCGRIFFSRVIPHATQAELSRNDSVNMTVNSAYCNRLPRHTISIQLSICGMRLNIWS